MSETEYTSFEDFKAWKSEIAYNTIGNFVSIENKGVVNGDCKLIVEKNKMPLINDEYVAMKVSNGIGDEFTVTLGHGVDEGYWQDWLENLLGTFAIEYLGYSYNNTLGFIMAYLRPTDTTYGTTIVLNVRKKVNGVDSVVSTIDDTTFDWFYRELQIPTDIIPVGEGWHLEMYSNRFLSTEYKDTPSISNYGRGIRGILATYNITSYLRANNMLPLYIEGYSKPIEDSTTTGTEFFYDCYTYETDFGETYKDLVYHKWGNIKVPQGCRVWGVVNNNTPYNIRLYVSNGYEFLGAIQNDGTYTTMSSLDVEITTRKTITDGNGNYYWGALSTNIPIFDNEEDGQRYDETGDDGATIYDDVWNGSTTHRFGDLVVKNNTNNYNVANSITTIYDITTKNLTLASWLYDLSNQQLFSECVLWGNNPIDMVVDYYWTPLDINALGYNQSAVINYNIYFGGIEAGRVEGEVYVPIQCDAKYWSVMGNEYTLFDVVMDRVYNDWRDYELFVYKLYIPFYGLVDLPSYVITGKPIKLTCNYFIHSHVLKYYLYINNVIYQEYEIIVGVNLPLVSSDAVGKAQENLSGVTDAINGGINMVSNPTVGGVVGGIESIANGIIKTQRGATMSNWGTTSVSGNICDYTIPIMVIEEQQHYAPTNLHSLYNYPSYYIGNISSCNGYCEISDVRLTGCGTFSDDEKEQIKSLLKGGIIL